MRAYAVQTNADGDAYYKTKQDALTAFRRACVLADESYDAYRPTVTLRKVEIATDYDTILDILNGSGGYVTDEIILAEYTAKERDD